MPKTMCTVMDRHELTRTRTATATVNFSEVMSHRTPRRMKKYQQK